MVLELIRAFKNEKFTGDNRCGPCTLINLVLAALISFMALRRSRIFGGAVAVASVAIIYFRGYLVPGTPELTERYLPDAVLRAFGKDPNPQIRTGLRADSVHGDANGGHKCNAKSPESDTSSKRADTSSEGDDSGKSEVGAANPLRDNKIIDLESYLLKYGVIEPNETGDDLQLTESVDTEWTDAMDPLLNEELTEAMISEKFGFDAGANLELQRSADAYVLTKYGRSVGDWPSRAALVADLAATEVLDSRLPNWEALSPEQRGELLNALRMFLEECPGGGETVSGEAVIESCCSAQEVVAVTCEETGERIFEHPV